MKTKVETVYHCEFCNKVSINKGAMTRHVSKCRENPNNQHSCFTCKYLVVEEPEYEFPYYSFTCENEKCKFYNKELHTYRLDDDPVRTEGLIRMPTRCSHYKYGGI
jgi:hypothetical protein